MSFPLELLQQVAVPAAEALVAGLWQGIALALVTGLVLRFLPGTTASARFAVWTAVFCASAAMPLAHLFTANSTKASAGPGHLLLDARWSYLLASLWLGAAILRLTRLLAEAVSLRKLWREACPLAHEAVEAANLHSLGGVKVCSTPDVDRPSVIGFIAPKILIPQWLCAQLSATELRHIVLHEMEHLRRRDDWLNLLQKIGLVLFPLNPAMFWIDRRLSTEREIACDDGVLARTNTPRAYAASLTSIAERRLNLDARRRMVALALGAFGTGRLFARRSEFARRIESILNSVGGQQTAGRPAIAAALIAAIMGVSAAIAHTPELISFRTVAGSNAVASTGQTLSESNLAAHLDSSAPHFVNARFRLPSGPRSRIATPSGRPATASGRPEGAVLTRERNPISAIAVKETLDAPSQATPRKPNRQAKTQWLVLTSWEEASGRTARGTNLANAPGDDAQHDDFVVPVSSVPVSRVVVRTPDGRFFATPYAAVPTQAGWLIVQL